jgi:hypothetical protein
VPVDAEARGDREVAVSLLGQQDDATALCHLLGRAMRANPTLEQKNLLFIRTQRNESIPAHLICESESRLFV